VVLGPVITDQQQRILPSHVRHKGVQPAEGAARGLMDSVLTPHCPAGTPPHQRSGLPADQPGHGLNPELGWFRRR